MGTIPLKLEEMERVRKAQWLRGERPGGQGRGWEGPEEPQVLEVPPPLTLIEFRFYSDAVGS